MERRRRRNPSYENMTADEQVQHLIEFWDIMFYDPFEEDFAEYNEMTVDDLEYRDSYFIPKLKEEIKGTEFERYQIELVNGYMTLNFH